MDDEQELKRLARRRSPRLGAILELLFQHAPDIERIQTGSVELHCSAGRVVLKLNGAVGERKVAAG